MVPVEPFEHARRVELLPTGSALEPGQGVVRGLDNAVADRALLNPVELFLHILVPKIPEVATPTEAEERERECKTEVVSAPRQ